MWIMLMQTIASACSVGHGRVTSSASGAARFARPASSRWAAMLASAVGSASLGCHVNAGNAWANAIACSPLPLAISSTMPRSGNTRARTSRIGSRLRAVAGACCCMARRISRQFGDVLPCDTVGAMKTSLALVAVLAFAACKKESAGTAANAGDCAAVIGKAIDDAARSGVASGAGSAAPKAEVDKMANDMIVSLAPVKAATIKACVDDKWSGDALTCLKQKGSITDCDDKLTDAQRTHRDELAN